MSALLFDGGASGPSLTFASSSKVWPILIDSKDNEAIHVAAETFADDIERVVGVRPKVYKDELPAGADGEQAIIASTVDSALARKIRSAGSATTASGSGAQQRLSSEKKHGSDLAGKWESYEIRAVEQPLQGVKQGLVVTGSDRRGVIFALYTLSEQMGVSPWYWWADVAVQARKSVAFPSDLVLAHGEPTVKYRGFFLNDEQPVLWNWAKEHFKMGNKPPFQVGMYEKVFELVLRLKGNYMWPAMWASMFAVDGMDVENGLPAKATPGPNQALADRMGVVMGTSHHEPMSRNQKEYTTWGEGDWNFETNEKWLTEFWKYGAERAKGLETVFTVGMRGDGDLPLDGANVPLLERITAVQQDLLRKVYETDNLDKIPQLWAIYKEVMGYFANGLKVPEEVTALLADDNWGNLQAVMPTDRKHAGGGGIYYHADYVGDPRDYKWTNTVPLAKMWEQLNIARSFNTTQIWICNVGDLKVLETPLEFFMSIGYDSDAIPRDGLKKYLASRARRDYGDGVDADEVADIMATYSIYASRRKAELVDSNTYSILAFEEAERVLEQWSTLEKRAKAVYDKLPKERQSAFYQMVYSAIQLNHNLNKLYTHAAKSNLYATQGRAAANFHAQSALDCFERDWELTQEYHKLEGGKWKHVLNQPHINYQYWQMPVRNSMPPISFISKHEPSYQNEYVIHTRYTVQDSQGAWPGDNKFNCPLGYNCPDPTLQPMDRYGRARWVDIGSGGPEDIEVHVEAVEDWMIVEPKTAKIKAGGADDVRVWINVDWEKVDRNASAGHVKLHSNDGAKVTVITLPLNHVEAPPAEFKGAVQGDGYVAIEAARATALTPAESCVWGEIPFYGRTHSGMSVYPIADLNFTMGEGPSMRYDFWATSVPESGKLDVTLHIGPSLNFVLGKRLAIGVQLDNTSPEAIYPVPEAKLGDLPHDWEDVVAKEMREVKITLDLGAGAKPGKHSITLWGITAGVVVERVLIDMGGIAARGYSYLGPPESVVVA